MKLKMAILSAFLSSCMLLGACAPAGTSSGGTTAPDNETTTDASAEATTTPESATEAPPPSVTEPPKSIKILAIGNSFSTDSMEYLYGIAKDGGVEEIVLGNLYYGGCSLAQHLNFAKNDSGEYKYYKNTSGNWGVTNNYKMSDAINDEDWDYISLQQTSKTCGLVSSYGKTLTDLIDYVRSKNSTAKLIWNMTWAYQQDSTHTSFPNYDKSQQKMYDMIIECVEKCIETEDRFELIIPCMTSIQNARTSFLGDTLTRDGYHLDTGIGRYIAGLTWYAAITGAPIDGITYNPSTSRINDDMLAVARESVKNAIATPKAVTPSKLTEGKRPDASEGIDPSLKLDPADFFEADKAVAAANGVDLTKYKLYEWEYVENGYWYCTKNTSITYPGSSAGTYKQNVCTKEIISLSDIPLGSVFICDNGWQYRMEIYPEKTQKYSGARPSISTSQFFTLTENFMNGCKYLAWNVSSNPKSDISAIYAQAACHVRVYVPVN